MTSDVEFWAADPEEDAQLARILTNAFLPVWNHNWFQGLDAPLDPIDTSLSSARELSKVQTRRLAFYRGLVSLTRKICGSVHVAESVSSPKTIAAVLLFFPPNCQASALTSATWTSGFASALIGYGLKPAYRVVGVFESNVNSMFASGLAELGWKPKQCGFVQMIARNPDWSGEKGAAGALLQWRMERFWEGEGTTKDGKRVPVILDATTVQAIKVYERLRFKIIGERKVSTGTDARGIRTNNKQDIKDAEDICKQRVMVRLP